LIGDVELREEENPVQAGVQAVADGDVHQPVFARERDGRLAAFHGQGIQTRAASAAHDD
jgi:hypothetical protein